MTYTQSIHIGTSYAGQPVAITKIKGGWAVTIDGVRVRGVLHRRMVQKNLDDATREAMYLTETHAF
jgi:hypothetical protein